MLDIAHCIHYVRHIAHCIYTVLDIAHHSEIVLSSPGDGLQYNLLSRKGEEEKKEKSKPGPSVC